MTDAHDELRALRDAGPDRAAEAEGLARELITRHPPHSVGRFTQGAAQTLSTLELAYDTAARAVLGRARTNELAQEALDLAQAGLHLDHERPVHLMCARWAKALPAHPASWDDGIDGDALCHDLFGVRDDEQHGR